MKYDVFLSYSHADAREVSRNLQYSLQKFAKPWWKTRGLYAFRDDTDICAAPDGWAKIRAALDESRFLLLLASPQAAMAPWVKRELIYFLSGGQFDPAKPSELQIPFEIAEHRRDHLLIALVSGQIVSAQAFDTSRSSHLDWNKTTALPRLLEHALTAEPFWVDFRFLRNAPSKRRVRRDPEFTQAIAKLAAPIRGLEVESLIGVHNKERKRAVIGSSAAALALIIAIPAAILFLRSYLNSSQVELGRRLGAQSLVAAEEATRARAIRRAAGIALESWSRHKNVQAYQAAVLSVNKLAEAFIDLRSGAVQALPSNRVLAQSLDDYNGRKVIVDLLTGTIIARPKHPSYTQFSGLISDRESLLSLHRDGSVWREELASGELENLLPAMRFGRYADVAPYPSSVIDGGQVIFLATPDRTILKLNAETGSVETLGPFSHSILGVTASATGEFLVAVGDGVITTFETASGESDLISECGGQPLIEEGEVAPLNVQYAPVKDGFFVTSGKMLCVSSGQPDKLDILDTFNDHIQVARMSLDGLALAAADANGEVRIYDLQNQAPPIIVPHDDSVYELKFSRDGQMLASGDWLGNIKITQAAERRTFDLSGHRGGISILSFSADNQYLLSGGYDAIAKVHDITDTSDVRVLREISHDSTVVDAGFFDESRLIFTSSENGVLRLASRDSAQG
ncbi:MAG: TIR domain-containing protein, partial [Parvularcula sp.]|nr:TIR domain-containing protein [Parvularcula sp.]